MRLRQRVALVTGAAAGLGQEFAVALAREGASVVGVDIDAMETTARRIETSGGRFLACIADVTVPGQVAAAVTQAVERFGGLHIVVNNAGIFPAIPFEDTSLEDVQRIMRVNVEGPFMVTQAALPHLKAAGWGRIVMISSAVVFLGPPDMVAYTASKSALVGMTRALATALGPLGITVNAIAPGLTATATAARTVGANGGFERVIGMQCIAKQERAVDLVSALLFVCDEGSGFLTARRSMSMAVPPSIECKQHEMEDAMGSVLNEGEVASLARLCELIVPGSARVGPVDYIQAKAAGMPAPVVELLRGAIASLAPHAGSAEALTAQVDTPAFGFIRSLAIEAFYGDYAAPGYHGPTAYDDIDFNSPQARRVRKDWSFLGPGRQT